MNRLLATASKAVTTCRSSGIIVNNHQFHRYPAVAAPLFSTAAKTTTPPLSTQRFFAARHFSDTTSDSSPAADDETNKINADDDIDNSSSSSSSNSNNNNSGDEIKRGTVKNFNKRNGWGFIIPDGVDRRNHKEEELVFIHRAEIKTREFGNNANNVPEERYYPNLKPGQRVQFKVGPPANNKAPAGKAYDLTMEGGGLVAPFQPEYLTDFIRKQKAMFGDEVYDIFCTSKDQKELEMKIVAAFDRVKGNIERQRAKVERFSDMTGDDGQSNSN